MAGIHAATSGETIGAPMASFTLIGGKVFEMSQETAILPLNQALAFLRKEDIHASVSRNGTIYASIHDYAFRDTSNPAIESINYWDFAATQQIYTVSNPKKKTSVPGTTAFFHIESFFVASTGKNSV